MAALMDHERQYSALSYAWYLSGHENQESGMHPSKAGIITASNPRRSGTASSTASSATCTIPASASSGLTNTVSAKTRTMSTFAPAAPAAPRSAMPCKPWTSYT